MLVNVDYDGGKVELSLVFESGSRSVDNVLFDKISVNGYNTFFDLFTKTVDKVYEKDGKTKISTTNRKIDVRHTA